MRKREEKRVAKARHPKKKKEPSFISKVILLLHEDALRRRAIRRLEKQSWSLDFLALVLVKAGRSLGENISLTITNKEGTKIELSYDMARNSDAVKNLDDSIFMHLDDDLAVERFIKHHSTRSF